MAADVITIGGQQFVLYDLHTLSSVLAKAETGHGGGEGDRGGPTSLELVLDFRGSGGAFRGSKSGRDGGASGAAQVLAWAQAFNDYIMQLHSATMLLAGWRHVVEVAIEVCVHVRESSEGGVGGPEVMNVCVCVCALTGAVPCARHSSPSCGTTASLLFIVPAGLLLLAGGPG